MPAQKAVQKGVHKNHSYEAWAEAFKGTKEVPLSRLKQRETAGDSFARLKQQPTSYKTDRRKGGVYDSKNCGWQNL